jgi:Rrf2 family protein
MYVSRKADYAVRALAFLASQPGRRVLIAEVAQEMAIPQAFLAKIMKQLVGGGLVHSQPGRGGGYSLRHAPEDITFRQILEAVEGPWTLVPCQDGEDACLMHDHCGQVSVWDRIRGEMLQLLAEHTLAEAALSAGDATPRQITELRARA